MCDYSLQSVKTRNAALHDELVTTNFQTGTRGFACKDDPSCAVCIQPGTEIAFESPIEFYGLATFFDTLVQNKPHTTAIFRQVNKEMQRVHHDCLEFPDGSHVLLSMLKENQQARILQLPAAPKNKAEEAEQTRVEYAG